jgi:hypothetical protein
MAARVFSPKHDQHTRDKIQTSQLVNRLNSFALDTTESIRMTSDQVRAALGLLKKTIPDLAVTSHVGPTGGAVLIVTGVERDIADTHSSEVVADFPERGFKG